MCILQNEPLNDPALMVFGGIRKNPCASASCLCCYPAILESKVWRKFNASACRSINAAGCCVNDVQPFVELTFWVR